VGQERLPAQCGDADIQHHQVQPAVRHSQRAAPDNHPQQPPEQAGEQPGEDGIIEAADVKPIRMWLFQREAC
jgi:hypothetical protein